MDQKGQVTAVLLAKNEASIIEDALKSISFCSVILHVDNGSTDGTIALVKKYHGRTIKTTKEHFNERKNIGLIETSTPWVFFIDADERITPALRQEIVSIISRPIEDAEAAYSVPRKNIYLGKEMKFGGWGGESIIRLFQTAKLKEFTGILHEQPVVEGQIGKLSGELVHFSHRNLESMVEKTILFTHKEALLRIQANHPPVTWWRFFRIMATEFYYRFIKLHASGDGTEGVIDGIFQVFNSFIIYSRLWQMQRNTKASS